MSFKEVKLNYVYFIKQLIFTIKQIESEQLGKITVKNLSFTFARICLHWIPGFITNCTTHFKPLMVSYFNPYLFFQEKFYIFRLNLQFYM